MKPETILFKLILAALLLNTAITTGQTKNNYSISGQLVDSLSREPIEYAAAVIYKFSDTSLVSGGVSNSKGEFLIDKLPQGKLIIKFSYVGYKTITAYLEIRDSSINLFEPILMSISPVYLNTVVVTGQLNEKQINIEKTKINVAQNISSMSGNVTDILKSQSSISIDADNSVYLRGNSNILILLDGKPTTVTSLNSIPASGVESIDIITNPDTKYDAEGTGGIINIIMKNQGNAGLNGILMLNSGLYNRVNGLLSLNYSKSIWSLSLSYNGKYEKSNIHSNLIRQLFTEPVYAEQEINSKQTARTHTAAFQISVKPENNIISLGLKLVLPDIINSQNITGQNVIDTLPGVYFNRKNEVEFSRKILEGTLNYKKIFEKNKNEISFDAFYSRTKGSRPAEYFIENEILQKSEGGGAPTNITIQADYLKSAFGGKIESGLKAFSRWNNFNYNFYDLDTNSNQWITNTAYSNDLDHEEYIYSTYLMYSGSLLEKVSYKAGIRLEYSTSELVQKSINYKLNREYLFPFPFLMIKYNMDNIQEIGLSINRRITRPTYPQLNPFISVIDQMTYETGNKYLTPEISDKVELYHSLTQEQFQFSSKIYFSTAKDFITQVSLLSSADKLFLTFVNGSRQNKIGGDFDGTIKLNKMFLLSPGVSVFYTMTNGKLNEIDLSTNNLAWSGNIKTIFRPQQETEFQILLNYNSPISLPQFNLSKIYYADISAKRSFFDNKLILSLTLSDIFNTRKWLVNSANNIFSLNNSSKNDTRLLWFGITYNLNSILSQTPKNEGAEIDDNIIKLGGE